MIIFDHVTHYYRVNDTPVLHDASFKLPAKKKIALFGLRGSGRSTVIKLVAGNIPAPRRGVISRGDLRISHRLGATLPAFPRNTVQQNLLDIARLHGYPYREIIDFIIEHGEVEDLLTRKLSTLTPAERVRVMTPISFLLPFDYYVADGEPISGLHSYRARFKTLFKERIEGKGLFMVARNVGNAREYCDAGAIMFNRTVTVFDDLEEAAEIYVEKVLPYETKAAPMRQTQEEYELEEASDHAEIEGPTNTWSDLQETPARRGRRAKTPPPADGVFL